MLLDIPNFMRSPRKSPRKQPPPPVQPKAGTMPLVADLDHRQQASATSLVDDEWEEEDEMYITPSSSPRAPTRTLFLSRKGTLRNLFAGPLAIASPRRRLSINRNNTIPSEAVDPTRHGDASPLSAPRAIPRRSSLSHVPTANASTAQQQQSLSGSWHHDIRPSRSTNRPVSSGQTPTSSLALSPSSNHSHNNYNRKKKMKRQTSMGSIASQSSACTRHLVDKTHTTRRLSLGDAATTLTRLSSQHRLRRTSSHGSLAPDNATATAHTTLISCRHVVQLQASWQLIPDRTLWAETVLWRLTLEPQQRVRLGIDSFRSPRIPVLSRLLVDAVDAIVGHAGPDLLDETFDAWPAQWKAQGLHGPSVAAVVWSTVQQVSALTADDEATRAAWEYTVVPVLQRWQ